MVQFSRVCSFTFVQMLDVLIPSGWGSLTWRQDRYLYFTKRQTVNFEAHQIQPHCYNISHTCMYTAKDPPQAGGLRVH